MIRVLNPKIVVETGVAFGKSSALILLALYHNNSNGQLFSFDLPNEKGNTLDDGSKTSTEDKKTGYLIPKYLRNNWMLVLGNSLETIPLVLKDKKVDFFIHDSLHTYSHTKKEFELIKPFLSKKYVLGCDNLEMDSGDAFSDVLNEMKLKGSAFNNFAYAINEI